MIWMSLCQCQNRISQTSRSARHNLLSLQYITYRGQQSQRKGVHRRTKKEEDFIKEEAASLTLANKLVFLTGIIDAKEHWGVVKVDITGPYLHAVNDHDVYMVSEAHKINSWVGRRVLAYIEK